MYFLCRNYEHVVKTNQNLPTAGEAELPEEIKFRVVNIFITHIVAKLG